MTASQEKQDEKEAIYRYEKTKRDLTRHRGRIEMIADKLDNLVRGLRSHPESVTPTPEIDGLDCRDGLNLLSANTRKELIALCSDVRELESQLERAAAHKAGYGF